MAKNLTSKKLEKPGVNESASWAVGRQTTKFVHLRQPLSPPVVLGHSDEKNSILN